MTEQELVGRDGLQGRKDMGEYAAGIDRGSAKRL